MPQSESPETRLKGLLETKPDKDSLAQGVEETDRLDEDEYDQRIRYLANCLFASCYRFVQYFRGY